MQTQHVPCLSFLLVISDTRCGRGGSVRLVYGSFENSQVCSQNHG